jgi:hypothetical protein
MRKKYVQVGIIMTNFQKHTRYQKKSQWKDVLNICSGIYAFLMKKQCWLSVISFLFCFKSVYYTNFLWQKCYL